MTMLLDIRALDAGYEGVRVVRDLSLHVEPTEDVAIFGGAHRGFSPVSPGAGADVEPETALSYELGARATAAESHVELIGFASDYANITGLSNEARARLLQRLVFSRREV